MDERFAEQGISYLFQMYGMLMNTSNTMTGILLNTFGSTKDPICKEWARQMKNGNTDTFYVNVEDVKEIQKQLKERGCECVVGTFDGVGTIITLANQRELVQEVVDAYNTVHSFTTHTDAETLSSISNGEIVQLNLRDVDTAMFIKMRCEQNNIPYVLNPSQSGYTIQFSEENRNKMELIKADVAYDLASPVSNIYRRQLRYEDNSYCKNLNDVLNGENIGTVLVSKTNGMVLNNNKNKVTIQNSNGEQITSISRNDDSLFHSKTMAKMLEMGNSVMLTKEQYEQYNVAENKNDFLLNVERENGRPNITSEELDMLKKHESKRRLIEEKLTMEHFEEEKFDVSDYNSEQPLQCFMEKERDNMEHNHDIAESQQIDSTILDDASAMYDGFVTKSLDYDISVLNSKANQVFDNDVQNMDQSFDEQTQEVGFGDFEQDEQGE